MSEGSAMGDFFSHLRELRRHIVRAFIYYVCALLPLAVYSKSLFSYMSKPMLAILGNSQTLVSTQIVGTVFVPLKLAMLMALFITAPLILYEMWKFVVPGLFPNEIKRAKPILISAVFFFYAGCCFAFFVALPLMFKYFNAVTPEGVTYMPDISNYFDFLIVMFIAFGIAFEVPVVCYILLRFKILDLNALTKSRPYFIMTTAIITAIITPPDALSMLLVLVPMWLLFEGSLIFFRYFLKDEN
ncbi:MAG: twin-arginine translocase subunit TatC [Methylacidiphilales bacterium]|nr:twin-arginine translocase subunit TatC [Candidatus Methylacidiphilales bacterium]